MRALLDNDDGGGWVCSACSDVRWKRPADPNNMIAGARLTIEQATHMFVVHYEPAYAAAILLMHAGAYVDDTPAGRRVEQLMEAFALALAAISNEVDDEYEAAHLRDRATGN